MDGLAFHPYPDNSSQSPDFPHPNSTTIGLADYDKLVALLAEAFDGTAQQGSTLPILYDEFGIESVVPDGKKSLYTGTEPTTTRPVDERQQAAAYDLGLRFAFCQPTVAGVLLFHTEDERALVSWQSGVYYADATPKASFWAVKDSLDRARGGSIAKCDGVALDVRLTNPPVPRAARVPDGQARHSLPLHVRLLVGARRDANDDGRRRGARPRPRSLRPAARRVAQGPQARSRASPPLAHGRPPGQPGRAVHANERRAPPRLASNPREAARSR